MIGSNYWKATLAFFGKWVRHIPRPQKRHLTIIQAQVRRASNRQSLFYWPRLAISQ
jgi:hypothetical protein